MKKALIYSLSLALLLVVVLVACNRPQADRPAEPQEADPAVTSTQADVSTSEPVKDTAPELSANTTPEPEPEQTLATPAESEDTQPPEDTTPQEPAQEQITESQKETEPVTQSSGAGGSTTQTKPQGQQGQQGQTQQQGQQNQQPTGDISGGGSREDFINNIGQVLDNAGYTPGSKAPLTADEKAGIADAISGRGGQTQGNLSGKTPEQVKAEEEATQKALDDMLNDWLSGN